ncbi:MAG: transposase [Kiritimatiellia bacterium]|nr:transposase [Kiritimatiellia bacterium]
MNHRNAFQDYRAPAFYMITMTTLNRRPLFAVCADDRSTLNEDGWLAYNLWHAMPKRYPEIAVSTMVIMPDHLHGIVRVQERMAQSVGVPLRAFKSQVTSALRKKYDNPELRIWTPTDDTDDIYGLPSLSDFQPLEKQGITLSKHWKWQGGSDGKSSFRNSR